MTAHVLVVQPDEMFLLHPAGCVECSEGDYVERTGFTEFKNWKPGKYPVSWWSLFDAEGEYAEGLQLTYEDIPGDTYDGTTPTSGGRVLGFPYQGGRWAG